jgi:hypothetical protein
VKTVEEKIEYLEKWSAAFHGIALALIVSVMVVLSLQLHEVRSEVGEAKQAAAEIRALYPASAVPLTLDMGAMRRGAPPTYEPVPVLEARNLDNASDTYAIEKSFHRPFLRHGIAGGARWDETSPGHVSVTIDTHDGGHLRCCDSCGAVGGDGCDWDTTAIIGYIHDTTCTRIFMDGRLPVVDRVPPGAYCSDVDP